MLRQRRNNNLLAESLGPPVRLLCTENGENKVEEKSSQRSASSRKPPLSTSSLARAAISHGKENRYQCGTPRAPAPTINNRQTPNSTYPNSMCGSSGSNKSVNFVGVQTPSSTFPVSLPITGVPNTHQDTGITEPDAFPPPEVVTDKVHTSPNEEPPAIEANSTKTNRISKAEDVDVSQLRRGSDDGGTPAPTTTTTTNPPPPPPNGASTTAAHSSASTTTAPTITQPLIQDTAEDIVMMESKAGVMRFKRLKLLGCGGSSKVFKVVGESDYQTYALKEVYLKHVDPAIRDAYINEIRLLKKLNNKPEIITLYHYTYDKQEVVLRILLEYAEMDLNAVLRSHTTANRMATVLYFWNQMLEVVKVIHDEGVIHNDLKPENFVCIGARLKLIDFGIANRIEAEKTSIERDIRCGTINYMAPETIEANDISDRFKVGRPSDIWSLGCILYQMIYGRTPFQHIKNKLKKWQAIIDPAITIPFPPISNHSAESALDVMKKCLSRNPKERPTVDELLNHPFSKI